MRKAALQQAALLGTAAGMRALVPLAGLGVAYPRRFFRFPTLVAALGEWIYDKLPQATDRTAPAGLVARAFSGALAGGLSAHVLKRNVAASAIVGGLAALGSTFLFHRLRAAAAERVPAVGAAIGEDLLAVGLTRAALHR
jgi:hypothetical protein